MRQSAAKKIDSTEIKSAPAQVIDLHSHKQTATAEQIARQAEEAAHLAGNYNGPDFDAFEAKYALSAFA